ncbi:MAG TPA: hypothetical protein VL127_12000 [Bryobacteraceae bacterium]|jgi:hypothetical protein|nr:hypothetical protein [Bryobacteraceae bacterium]
MNATTESQEQSIELGYSKHAAIVLLTFTVLASRRPDAIFHAQFWAEDGRVWFANAYNLGWWPALLRAQDGYFQTLPRLGASLALLVPLSLAPLVLNLIAMSVQVLPVNLLLSARSSWLGNLYSRALFAGLYVVLPNCREISANITNSQWVMALCLFLVLVASTSRSVVGRTLDISILLLGGLTGPFCLFLLPIALFMAWRQHDRWRWVLACTLAAVCLVQAGALIYGYSIRPHYPLGASPLLFMRILGGHIYLGTLAGYNTLAAHAGLLESSFLLCLATGGTIIVAICFRKSPVEMKLFLLFSATLFAVSLIFSETYPPPGMTVWASLAGAPSNRYWFFPTLAFAWSLLSCLRSRTAYLRLVSAYLLGLMCIGIYRDWRHPAFRDFHFAEYVKRLEAAPVGTAIIIPVNPEGWDMRLVKH